jgi:iron(III) transport system permease protein
MFRSLTNSLYVSIVTMVITTVLAFFFAYGLTRTTIPGKAFLYHFDLSPDRSLHYPGISPDPPVRSQRLVTRYVLHTDWNIYGATGIIAAECLYCFPNALFILYTTLSAVDTRLDEAAQSLGASALKTFCKVTLPQQSTDRQCCGPVFNLTITDFGVPVVIEGIIASWLPISTSRSSGCSASISGPRLA